MARATTLLFAAISYAIFFATFLYMVAFVGNFPWVPVTIDRGPDLPVAVAVVVNLALIALFGFQHSIMARQGFKRWWTQFVPKQAERSMFVLAASLALIALMAFWQPIPAIVWSVGGLAAIFLWALFAIGWLVVLLSTFLINHFELFGLQQAWHHVSGRNAADPQFRTPLLYRLVRHPLYVGFFIAFWATPVMTAGHLLFAAGMGAFMLIGVRFEEKDLIDLFGETYVDYRRRVGMLIPRLG